MDIALWYERVISLTKCKREEIERFYQSSQKKEITCLHCGEFLQLHSGIEQAPYFIHPPSTFECEKMVSAYKEQVKEKEPEQAVAVQGFQLPQRKSISSGETITMPEGNWRPPDRFTKFPAFQLAEQQTETIDHSFYTKLTDLNYKLDANQWESVTATEGPLLLLAGAGSGKTRVITARTAYMLTEKNIPANRMLLVTFTAKAALEMKERMKIFPELSYKVLNTLLVGTFHSIFYRMLQHHEPYIWQKDKLLKWDSERILMLKEIGKELDLDEKDFAYDQALTQIGWWKNHLMTHKDIETNDLFEERTKHLYERYEEMKNKLGSYDFDDMLIGCHRLLGENPALLEKYQERFQYISVDEFQDVNKVQYKIIQMLAKKYKNLCVVGDDDQSIYAFRGSDPSYILNFTKDYPTAKTIVLKTNYRSTHPIVRMAHEVIRLNRKRHSKQVHSIQDSEVLPILFYPYDEEQEATMITTEIQEKLELGAAPSDFAILYRTNSNIRALFERLTQIGLPFIIEQDGGSFYERNAVRKVLAFLRLSLDPNHEQAMQEGITALFLKRTVTRDLYALQITDGLTLVEGLTRIKGIHDFQKEKLQNVTKLLKTLHTKKPTEAIELIQEKMGLSDFLKKNGNEGNKMDRGSDDVKDLLVAAKSFSTIPSFLEHVDSMIKKHHEMRAMKKETQNAIQLMTIHRSKGLEFENVYIVGAVEGSLPHEYALDAWRNGDDAPLEEERRLMYVAITRAKQKVSISVPSQYRNKRAMKSRFLPPL